jgi:N6-L-threonylcarbamoyladenine synthase
MLHDPNFDFSFSGLKTAVLYLSKDKNLSEQQKENLAFAFEEATADVLYAKTKRALEETGAESLALGGGVSANTHIKRTFRERLEKEMSHVSLFIPETYLTGDNAIMIALAGHFRAKNYEFADIETLKANGNMKLV